MEPKSRPMLFKTPMVKGIIQRIKKQTRRVFKGTVPDGATVVPYQDNQGNTVFGYWYGNLLDPANIKCPYGVIGDYLWIKETYAAVLNLGVDKSGNWPSELFTYTYKADDIVRPVQGWKSAMFMPKDVARIFLKITGIRVERLFDISEQDAIDEGVEGVVWPDGVTRYLSYTSQTFNKLPVNNMDARHSYFTLWEYISGRESFESNPYVWVINFEVVEVKRG